MTAVLKTDSDSIRFDVPVVETNDSTIPTLPRTSFIGFGKECNGYGFSEVGLQTIHNFSFVCCQVNSFIHFPLYLAGIIASKVRILQEIAFVVLRLTITDVFSRIVLPAIHWGMDCAGVPHGSHLRSYDRNAFVSYLPSDIWKNRAYLFEQHGLPLNTLSGCELSDVFPLQG